MKRRVVFAMVALGPAALGQGTFGESGQITATVPTEGDRMGFAVAVDGDTLVVGKPGDDAPALNQGSLHVYLRSGTSWTQQAKLKVAGAGPWTQFGSGVALDGDTIVAAGILFNFSGGDAAHVFHRTGTTWIQQAAFTGFGDDLGMAVAVDGDTAVLGAPFSDLAGTDAGAAIVFVRAGATWSQQAVLTASDANPQAQFGTSVAVEGDRVLVGAELRDRAYVFARSGATWSEEVKWSRTHRFGAAVALDADRALVGAPGDPFVGVGRGSAFVFIRSGTSWAEEVKLEAEGGEFGSSVSLDGRAALIGAPELLGTRGRAYGFARTSAAWFHQATFVTNGVKLGDRVGFSVALAGRTAVAGAPEDDVGSVFAAGSAYVFDLAPLAPVSYCTAGTSASGCAAAIGALGSASASATSGFALSASGAEGNKAGLFFYGSSGRQANPWGNGSSVQCIVPPVKRGGLLPAAGTIGACDGSFSMDLNARWCPACPRPSHNPGVGATVQAQLWYRDPLSTSNQTTSLSDSVEFVVTP